MIKNIVGAIIVMLGTFHTFAHGMTESDLYRVCEWNARTAVHIKQLEEVGIDKETVKSKMILRIHSLSIPKAMENERAAMITDISRAVDLIYLFSDVIRATDEQVFYGDIFNDCVMEKRV